MFYPLEISSDVMDNENDSVTRNENKAYETEMSNITNIDKLKKAKVLWSIITVLRKTMFITEIVEMRNTKQNMA